MTGRWIGAIEAGGTKVVCGAGRSLGELVEPDGHAVLPTSPDPAETWAKVRRHFAGLPVLDALGVASFGPLDLSAGTIGVSPKAGWKGFSWMAHARELTAGPVSLDTDVDAAALAEWRLGAAQGAQVAAYVTVGTGIGGGAVVGGRVVRGGRHPEMGHARLGRRPGDHGESACRHHDDCWEGLASGAALRLRHGRPAETLSADHPGWRLEAEYLGIGVANLLLTLAPDRLVLGGGVLGHPGLLEAVRQRAGAHLNGYDGLGAPGGRPLEEIVVAPGLGSLAGLVGAFVLAAGQLSPTWSAW